jgi:hypothetical protein
VYSQIKAALQNLSPEQVRELAGRPLTVGLIASSREAYAAMEDVLAPASLSRARRRELERVLYRVDDPAAPERFDLLLCESELVSPPGAFPFDPADPQRAVREVVERRENLSLALARNFGPFRKAAIGKIVRSIAKENALFALVTALPDVVPNIIELPWAVGEFASDTAVLTMNQVRMAFLIAAASDRDVGYREQRAQIAGIVGGAFGWRALARELVGKIPFGGGLIPKAAIAYAGTYTVGVGLERLYRIGYGLAREERRRIYEEALERGKAIVSAVVATESRA